jgi:hypothetical protein
MRRLALALLACSLPMAAGAQEASVRITNRGARAINEIYVASAGVNAWGEDRLGSRTLGSGASHLVALPPGQCVNDIRIVFDGGEAEERRRVNTCSQGDLVFP